VCKVPLSGFLSKIPKILLGVTVSSDPDLCNKCAEKSGVYKSQAKGPHHPSGKYRCQICDRDIDESAALVHVKAEEYLMELIRKDHPDWAKDKETCHKCLDYYRRLIREAEI